MKVLAQKGLQYTLKLEDNDDLWYANQLIDVGDLLKAKTSRKITLGTDQVRKTLTLKIEVEDKQLTGQLRVNGKVKEGTEDVPNEVYHAIALIPGLEFTLEKPAWTTLHKQKLTEATEARHVYLIAVVEREEAIIAQTKVKGIEVLANLQGESEKKRMKQVVKQPFFNKLAETLNDYIVKLKPKVVIIASPAFYKEEVAKLLQVKPILATCSGVSKRALHEVLLQPEVQKALKESRLIQETALVEEVLTAIKNESRVVYGFQQTIDAKDAIQTILVTDKFLEQKKDEKVLDAVQELLQHVENLRGEIHIISSKHDAGKQLDGLSGIAALLRYDVE